MSQEKSDNANDALWGIRDHLKENNKSLKDVFKDLDDDENKKISVEEFREGLLKLGIANLTETAVDDLVSTLDENGDKLYDIVAEYNENDRVLISGQFFIDEDTDYLTTEEIMKKNQLKKPEFTFRFTSIQKIN